MLDFEKIVFTLSCCEKPGFELRKFGRFFFSYLQFSIGKRDLFEQPENQKLAK